MTDAATAFAPGHVTAFFSVHRDPNPSVAGSKGAGLTLSDGVRATVCQADAVEVTLNGSQSSIEPVEAVLDVLDVPATVSLETPLPVGAGFGVSGAAALATALATNWVFDLGHTENELIDVAHRSEVRSSTGLGDVVAQARGGVPIRLDPGAPGYGALDGIPATGSIEYITHGEIDTEAVIDGDVERLSAAGEAGLYSLLERPTLPSLFAQGRTFATEAGLVTEWVRETIAAVREAGGEATMAMLGETVIALEDGLSAAGYDPNRCRIHPTGATLE